MYASMTTTRGSVENATEVAEMVGETMVEWLRDIEGFGGLLMLSNEETETTHVIALWESEEVAERHRAGRMRLRDKVTATVGVEVLETVPYEVAFAHLRGRCDRTTRRAAPQPWLSFRPSERRSLRSCCEVIRSLRSRDFSSFDASFVATRL